jgi:phosphoglycolate phosphatase
MKLLLFDIDGTLLKPVGFGKKAFLKAFGKLHGSLPETDFSYDGLLDHEIASKSLEYRGIAPTEDKINELLDSYVALLPSEIPEDPSLWLCPNIPNLLSEAGQKGFCLAVVTGNVRESAGIKLESTKLSGFFPAGAFGCDAKKRWELIPIAIERAGDYYKYDFSKEETFMVGDSIRDIEAARIAGVKSICVATGLAPFSLLSLESPDYILETLSSEGFWGLPI